MRHTRFLIIGQGISGSFLSWHLCREPGSSCIVIDNGDDGSASRVAAGVMNPVTGRRIVRTWMIETLLPFAVDAYERMGKELNLQLVKTSNTIDFFPTPQMYLAFRERAEQELDYLSLPTGELGFRDYFNYDFGYGIIAPCYTVQLNTLLVAWRKHLRANQTILEENFDVSRLRVSDRGVTYKDIAAEKVIFCDGMSAVESPWFQKLPFAPNKGEALIIRSPDLPAHSVYKKSLTLVPQAENLFWAGSSYEWNFSHNKPSSLFYERTINQLKDWLRVPFTVENHLSSVRPATLERRPFVGMHPHYPRIGILNGMGTKGCSLAPFFAHQLCSHLLNGTPILPEASVSRFSRILRRDTEDFLHPADD